MARVEKDEELLQLDNGLQNLLNDVEFSSLNEADDLEEELKRRRRRYRRRRRREQARAKLVEEQKKSLEGELSDQQKSLQKLERAVFNHSKSCRVLLFTVLLICLILLVTITIGGTWENTAVDNLYTSISASMEQSADFGSALVMQHFRPSIVAAEMFTGSVFVNEFVKQASTSTSPSGAVFPLRVNDLFAMFAGRLDVLRVDGLHLTRTDGVFVGVFRPADDTSSSSYIGVAQFFDTPSNSTIFMQCDVTANNISSCQEFPADAGFSDPRTFAFYTNAAMGDDKWSAAYPLLRVEAGSPGTIGLPTRTVSGASSIAVLRSSWVGHSFSAPMIDEVAAVSGVIVADVSLARLSESMGRLTLLRDSIGLVTTPDWQVLASSTGESIISSGSVSLTASNELMLSVITALEEEAPPQNGDFGPETNGLIFDLTTAGLIVGVDAILGRNQTVRGDLPLAVVIASSEDDFLRSRNNSWLFTGIVSGFCVLTCFLVLVAVFFVTRESREARKTRTSNFKFRKTNSLFAQVTWSDDDDEVAEIEHSDGDAHPKRVLLLDTIMHTLLILVCWASFSVFAVWSVNVRDDVDLVNKLVVSESENRLFSAAQESFVDPSRMISVMSDDVFSSLLLSALAISDGQNSYDSYMVSLLQAFQESGLSDVSGDFPASNVFLGFPNGEYIGAEVFAVDGDSSQIIVAAKDDIELFSGVQCLQKYATKIAPDTTNAIVRDVSSPVLTTPLCDFNPTSEMWYTSAVSAGAPVASSPRLVTNNFFATTDNPLVRIVTFSAPLFDTNGDLFAVAGVNVNFDVANLFFRSVLSTTTLRAEAFLVARDLTLLANSAETRTSGDSGRLLSALDSEDELLAAATLVIVQAEGGIGAITTTTQQVRPLDKPDQAADVVSATDTDRSFVIGVDENGSGWVAVVTVDFFPIWNVQDNRNQRSFLLSLGSCVLGIALGASGYITFRRRVLDKRDSGKNYHIILEKITGREFGAQKLQEHIDTIEYTVLEASKYGFESQARSEQFSKGEYNEPEEKERAEYYQREAISHVRNAFEGRNIITMCLLALGNKAKRAHWQMRHKSSAAAFVDRRQVRSEIMNNQWHSLQDNEVFSHLGIYRWYTSTRYRLFFNLIAIWHVLLVFWKPATFQEMQDNGPSLFVIVVEASIILVELFDFAIDYLLKYKWVVDDTVLEDTKSIRTADTMYAVLLTLIIVDYFLFTIINFSYEYIFPLRIFILLLRNPEIREVGKTILTSIYYARNVFLLYMLLVLVASSIGLMLFRNILDSDAPVTSYSDYFRAFISTFTLMSTGENYSEVIFPTTAVSNWYSVYWAVFIFLGLFFILAMIVSFFQAAFKQLRIAEARKKQMFQRTGIAAAYILLDYNKEGHISFERTQLFLHLLRPHMSIKWLNALMERFGVDNERPATVMEFVIVVEQLMSHTLVLKKDMAKVGTPRVMLQLLVFERSWFRSLRLLVVLTHLWVTSLYSVWDNDEQQLDYILIGFIGYYTLELIMRVVAYGWDEFWNYSRYHGSSEGHFQLMANRIDAILVFASFVGMCAAIALTAGTFDRSDDALRVILVIPVLRLFILIDRIRDMVFTLILLTPRFASVIVLLMALSFIYANIGIWMINDRLQLILQENAPLANFTSMDEAIKALFQLLLGENWDLLMYDTINTRRNLNTFYFFVSYVFFATLIFGNVFIGIIMDAFYRYVERQNEDELSSELRWIEERRVLDSFAWDYRTRSGVSSLRGSRQGSGRASPTGASTPRSPPAPKESTAAGTNGAGSRTPRSRRKTPRSPGGNGRRRAKKTPRAKSEGSAAGLVAATTEPDRSAAVVAPAPRTATKQSVNIAMAALRKAGKDHAARKQENGSE